MPSLADCEGRGGRNGRVSYSGLSGRTRGAVPWERRGCGLTDDTKTEHRASGAAVVGADGAGGWATAVGIRRSRAGSGLERRAVGSCVLGVGRWVSVGWAASAQVQFVARSPKSRTENLGDSHNLFVGAVAWPPQSRTPPR